MFSENAHAVLLIDVSISAGATELAMSFSEVRILVLMDALTKWHWFLDS